MQIFKDRETEQEYHFEDDVVVVVEAGVNNFFMRSEGGELVRIGVPETLDPLQTEEVSPAFLQALRDAKRQELLARYHSNAQRSVLFDDKSFDGTFECQEILHNLLAASNDGEDLGEGVNWLTTEGVAVTLEPHELRQIAMIMSARRALAYVTFRKSLLALSAVRSAEEIEAL